MFSGIVYHANYLRFLERGRTNHLRLMGAEQHALFEQAEVETPGFAFVVRSMELDFLRPARMDDVLDIVTWPIAVKGASIMLGQEVRRDKEVLVKVQVRVAFISESRDDRVLCRSLVATPPPCGARSRPCRVRTPPRWLLPRRAARAGVRNRPSAPATLPVRPAASPWSS